MKAISTFLICFLCLSQNIFSQKIKTKYVNVEYTRLPDQPLDANFKTYSVSVTDPFAVLQTGNLDAENLVKKHLTLTGFKPLPAGSDFHINISIGQYVLLGHEIKEESEKKTRKVKQPETTSTESSTTSTTSKEKARVTTPSSKSNTTETPTKSTTTNTNQKDSYETYYVTTYYKNIQYHLPISYVIIDYQGNKIKEGTLVGTSKKLNYSYGKKSTDAHRLEEDFKKNFARITSGMVGLTITNNVKSLGSWVKKNYDFQKINEKEYFRVLSKKSDGATEFNAAYELVNNTFAKMKYNKPIDQLKTEVKPAIDTWLKLKETYPANKKKGRRGRHACLYNIAATLYWMEEFNEATKYAKEGIAVGNRERHFEKIIENITATKKSMRTNRAKSRHFDRDIENYVEREMPPMASNANMPNQAPQSIAIPNNAITYDGFIIDKKGTRITGQFIISQNKKKELEFGKQGNITFRWNKNNVPLESHLAPDEVKSFGFNKRSFNCQPYLTALDNGSANNKIMECLFDSELMKVFKYYPYEPGINNNKTEISLQRKSDTIPVSTVGNEFLIFKRGLAEFFKACPDLSELALNGEFEKNEVDIVRAAKAYAQYCN